MSKATLTRASVAKTQTYCERSSQATNRKSCRHKKAACFK